MLRYALVSCLLFFLAACAKNPPLVECTASIVPTVKSNSCEPGLWDIPLDVKVDGQVIGSIQPGRTPFGPFKYSNRQQLEIWAGKRQLDDTSLECDLGEHREFAFNLRHIEGLSSHPIELPCEGRGCLISAREVVSHRACTSHFSLLPHVITATEPPTQTCRATIEVVVEENSCARELWDLPIEVRLSGHVIGSIEPGATTFGPFAYAEPDAWVELRVGKRQLDYWYAMTCHKGESLTLTFSAWHQETVAPERSYLPCEGAECLETEYAYRQGTICVSGFDLRPRDLHE